MREEGSQLILALIETIVSLVGIVLALSFVFDWLWIALWVMAYVEKHPGVLLHYGEGKEWERMVEAIRQDRLDDLLWRDIAWPSDVAAQIFCWLTQQWDEMLAFFSNGWYLGQRPQTLFRWVRRRRFRRRKMARRRSKKPEPEQAELSHKKNQE
jgi:hypothetical protein